MQQKLFFSKFAYYFSFSQCSAGWSPRVLCVKSQNRDSYSFLYIISLYLFPHFVKSSFSFCRNIVRFYNLFCILLSILFKLFCHFCALFTRMSPWKKKYESWKQNFVCVRVNKDSRTVFCVAIRPCRYVILFLLPYNKKGTRRCTSPTGFFININFSDSRSLATWTLPVPTILKLTLHQVLWFFLSRKVEKP